jgi:polyisoprenoid-binding protein YceI
MKLIQAIPLFFLSYLPVVATAATLDVDQEKSRIQVDAKATGHAFTGTLEKFTASVEGDASSIKPKSFNLEWNFKDLKTDDDKRDKEMLAWLGGGDPKGKFVFEKSWTDDKGADHAMGKLTINGVEKSVSFPFTTKKEGDWVTIDGKAGLDYEDFKLPIIRAMVVMTVDPKLTVRFHIVGQIK